MELKEGINFKHYLSNNRFYTIKSIRRRKLLDMSSPYIAYIIDEDGEILAIKELIDILNLFKKGEWITI